MNKTIDFTEDELKFLNTIFMSPIQVSMLDVTTAASIKEKIKMEPVITKEGS